MKRWPIWTIGIALSVSACFAAGREDLPAPSDAGSFEGTWYYVEPGFQIALFIAPDKTGVQKIRYHARTSGGSEFETDEGGFAKYIDEGGTLVEVIFTGGVKALNRIEGYLDRTVHLKNETVRETADFSLYRSGKGRQLVLYYPNFKTERTDSSGHTKPSTQTDLFRVFRKASDIVVEFNEIPF